VPTPSGFRLSPQQQHLWSLLNMGPPEAFRPRCELLLEGPLDLPCLARAAADVLGRHEVLRTAYHRVLGAETALQVPGDVSADALTHLDDRDAPGPPGPSPFCLTRPGHERHLLSIDLPALSVDRRTLGLLVRELGLAYAARREGDALPPADLQYADVAEVFNQLLEADDTEAGRRHWGERELSTAVEASLPSGLASPVERASEPRRPFRPRQTPVPLEPETGAAIKAAAERAGVSPATFVLACWQLLLSRLSGQRAFTVAVCHDGRTYEGLGAALGLFERYLPLCGELPARTTLLGLARDIAEAQRQAADWQDYFDVTRVRPGAVGPRWFPFAFEEIAWPEPVRAGGLRVAAAELEATLTRHDLKLACVREGEALSLRLYHDASRYDAADVGRLVERLRTLVAAAAASPQVACDALPLVGEREARLLAGFNAGEGDGTEGRDVDEPPGGRDRCIYGAFERQARRHPERTAVVFEAERLSYGELAERARRLAWHLRDLGVTSEVRVGLCLERSVDMMVALLGIIGAGGAYVPLEPTLPRARLADVVERAGVRLVVTRDALRSALPPTNTPSVCLDADADAIARRPDAPPPGAAGPDALAYVLFTSGSTGRPKGVMVSHRSVLNLARALERAVYAGPPPALRVGLGAPLAFDASVKQWAQLLRGRELHLLPEDVRPDPDRTIDWLRRHGLDVFDCTPSLLAPLLARGLGREPDLSPSRLLVGGEAIDAQTWTTLARSERTRFVNVYGPTECTVDATACAAAESERPSIGRPLRGVRVYVLDSHLREAPLGTAGEIYVGGEGVSRGYAGQPAATAERFLPDPFGPPGSRLYRTGDVGRYRDDGRVEFLGRADRQVKLRGVRIEPGEIEALLRQHPGVADAAVMLREPSPGGPQLVAYVVPAAAASEGQAAPVAALRAYLRERLPEYMVPATFVELPRMPLNASGKLDHAALPEPREARPEAAPYVAPETPLERSLAALWREALRVERVGLDDNFFDLGGHSLLLVRVHERLPAIVGRPVSLVELFQYPTVAALARHLARANGDSGEGAAPAAPDMAERARRQRSATQQQGQRMKAERGKR
jgi:amino acid adenylation domain-containing protein